MPLSKLSHLSLEYCIAWNVLCFFSFFFCSLTLPEHIAFSFLLLYFPISYFVFHLFHSQPYSFPLSFFPSLSQRCPFRFLLLCRFVSSLSLTFAQLVLFFLVFYFLFCFLVFVYLSLFLSYSFISSFSISNFTFFCSLIFKFCFPYLF